MSIGIAIMGHCRTRTYSRLAGCPLLALSGHRLCAAVMVLVQILGSYFAHRGLANCVLAWVAKSGEVLFDTQQDTTCAGLYARTLLLDIGPAGFAHRGDLHKRRLARLSEIIDFSPYLDTTAAHNPKITYG
jgi:hypothetical protein